jgi:hypothetical protein
MIVGFHHAQITIPKNQELAARRFYCELLQLNEIPKPASLEGRGGFWVQVGALALHIGTEDGVDRSKTKAHLAYEVRDLDKIRSCWISMPWRFWNPYRSLGMCVWSVGIHLATESNSFNGYLMEMYR